MFNTGEHIPADCKELIWSSFYKLDRARTRSHGGTGLGLSIVKAVRMPTGTLAGVITSKVEWPSGSTWISLRTMLLTVKNQRD